MKPNNIYMPSPLAEPQQVPKPVTIMAPPTPSVGAPIEVVNELPFVMGQMGDRAEGLMGVQSSGVEQLLQPIISRIQSQSQNNMQQKLPAYVQQITEITNSTFPNLFANGIGSIPNQFTNSLQPYQNQMNPMMADLFK